MSLPFSIFFYKSTISLPFSQDAFPAMPCLRKIITPQFTRHSAERSSWISRSRPSAWRQAPNTLRRSMGIIKKQRYAIDGWFIPPIMACTIDCGSYHPLWCIHTMTHHRDLHIVSGHPTHAIGIFTMGM